MTLAHRPYGPTTSGTTGLGSTTLNTSGAPAAVLPTQLVGNTTAEQVIPNPVVPTIALTSALEPNTNIEQVPFDLNASGYITTGASMTVTLKLYSGTSLTVGSDTLLLTSGAQTQNSATAPFWVAGKFVYDSVSGKLTGKIEFLINNTLVAAAVVSTVITTAKNTNNPVVAFALSATFSVANAANLLNLQNFSCG